MRTCTLRIACVALTGCTAGMGPSTAATRPLLGHTMKNDDAKMWVVSPDQSNVPSGLVRVEQVADGFARIFNYVSITSAARKGRATQTIAGVEGESTDVIDLDLVLGGRVPLPVGGISLGAGRLWSIEDTASLSGFGVRASVAPIGQLSLDFARSWLSGTLEESTTTTEIAGTRTSVGGTVLIWGYNQFRFGVSVAKTWTAAGTYESSGYTYSLVSTMY